MCPAFLDELDAIREACGFPFVVTSGYRSKTHPIESAKPNGPGTHTKGIAADIKCTGSYERYLLVETALEHGMHGIGIGKDFIHMDMRSSTPVMWVY